MWSLCRSERLAGSSSVPIRCGSRQRGPHCRGAAARCCSRFMQFNIEVARAPWVTQEPFYRRRCVCNGGRDVCDEIAKRGIVRGTGGDAPGVGPSRPRMRCCGYAGCGAAVGYLPRRL